MNAADAPARWSRALATAIDAGGLIAAVIVAAACSLAWLFARSGAGRHDVRELDARLAAAVVLAVPPAWLAWHAPGLLRGRTGGQRRAGLQVHGTAAQRCARFALHPLAVPLWLWLALVALATGRDSVALALLLVTGMVVLGGAVTLVRWVTWPRLPGLHDRLAGTRLTAISKRPA